MSRFLIQEQVNDATGAPVSGALVHTYVAGTTTPKTTYSDEALTTPNANPIVADAAGKIGPVYGTAGEPYKLVYADSDDVTLDTYDDLYTYLLTSDSLVTRMQQIASNPIDYGAVGDGVADESSEVQDAIDNASGTGVVDLLGLTFRCDSQLTVTAGLTIRNGSLDFSNCTDDECIKVFWKAMAPKTVLTADVTFADGKVSVTSVSGLAAGGLINISDSQAYTATGERGELAEIESIATLDVNLQGSALDAYATASSAAARKVNTVDNFTMSNVNVTGAEAVGGSTVNLLGLINCRRARIKDCNFNAIDFAAIAVYGSWDTIIEGCSFADGLYGVVFGDAAQHAKVVGSTFTGLEIGVVAGSASVTHASAANGVQRHIDVTGCIFLYGGSAASPQISITSDAQHVRVVGNTVRVFSSGNGDGIAVGCADAIVNNNEVYCDDGSADGIQLALRVPLRTGRGYALRCTGNNLRCTGSGVVYSGLDVTGGAGDLGTLQIHGNTVDYTGNNNIQVNSGNSAISADIVDLIITGNRITGDIDVDSDHASSAITTCTIDNNVCEAVNVSGTSASIGTVVMRSAKVDGVDTQISVGLDNIGTLIVRDLTVVGDGVDNDIGLKITNTTNVDIATARITGTVTHGVLIQEATEMSLSKVYAKSAGYGALIENSSQAFSRLLVSDGEYVATTNSGLKISAAAAGRSSDLKMTGNYFESAGAGSLFPLEVAGLIAGIVCNGNVGERGNDTDSNLYFAGSAPGGLTKLTISGCHTFNGTYGIEAVNHEVASSFHQGCTLASTATADVSGEFAQTKSSFAQLNTAQTLAAAATTFAAVGNVMSITADGGGNTIGTITAGVAGQILTIICVAVPGVLTFTDTAPTPAANQMALNGAWIPSADESLTLISNGTYWIEVSRFT